MTRRRAPSRTLRPGARRTGERSLGSPEYLEVEALASIFKSMRLKSGRVRTRCRRDGRHRRSSTAVGRASIGCDVMEAAWQRVRAASARRCRAPSETAPNPAPSGAPPARIVSGPALQLPERRARRLERDDVTLEPETAHDATEATLVSTDIDDARDVERTQEMPDLGGRRAVHRPAPDEQPEPVLDGEAGPTPAGAHDLAGMRRVSFARFMRAPRRRCPGRRRPMRRRDTGASVQCQGPGGGQTTDRRLAHRPRDHAAVRPLCVPAGLGSPP